MKESELSAGNDLVDLASPGAQKNSLHPKFDERVFTSKERLLILKSSNPLVTRWMLWACKESAYKLHKRFDSSLYFLPPKFECTLCQEGLIQVTSDALESWVKITLLETALHAIAVKHPHHFKGVTERVFKLSPRHLRSPSSVSKKTRLFALSTIAHALNISLNRLSLCQKTNKVPWLIINGTAIGEEKRLVPISFSHHGRFAAFATGKIT